MRLHYIDNIRWVTILLVMFFHVFYYYNAYCAGSGIGGFSDYQPQDAVVYLLYPWLMPLLFVVAGMSARYALDKYDYRTFVRNRTRKLLVPATIGLFVFQWISGYVGMLTINYHYHTDLSAGQPWWVMYLMFALTGGGGLWFIQLLWVFSLLTVPLNRIEKRWHLGKTTPLQPLRPLVGNVLIVLSLLLFGGLLYLGDQTVMDGSGTMQDPASLVNVYRPVYYGVAYLFGYYLFVHKGIQEWLSRYCWLTIPMAVVCGIWLTVSTFGQDAYSPQYLRSVGNNLYAWLAILAMFGGFKRWLDRPVVWTLPRLGEHKDSAEGMRAIRISPARISYGLYILQFVVYMSVGYVLRVYSGLPVWAMYALLMIAMFTLTPILYAVIRRIPVVRYCVLGEK